MIASETIEKIKAVCRLQKEIEKECDGFAIRNNEVQLQEDVFFKEFAEFQTSPLTYSHWGYEVCAHVDGIRFYALTNELPNQEEAAKAGSASGT